MKKKTKNYIKYKKRYVVINGEKFAPYRVEVFYDSYDLELDNKLIELAERNSGEQTDSGYGFGQRDLNFDFFTEKGMRQFARKAEKRYREKFDLIITLTEFSPGYQEI